MFPLWSRNVSDKERFALLDESDTWTRHSSVYIDQNRVTKNALQSASGRLGHVEHLVVALTDTDEERQKTVCEMMEAPRLKCLEMTRRDV